MKIQTKTLYAYSLPLAGPLPLRDAALSQRDGLLLRLTVDGGIIGWGEIAPLPGFSSETLDDATSQACFLAGMPIAFDVPENVIGLDGSIDRLLGPLGLHASVRFGIEMAVLNLFASRSGKSLAGLLSDHVRSSISVNGLITGSEQQIKELAGRFRSLGYRAVKLKVAAGTAGEDAERVRVLRETLGNDIAIRLDGNRSFEYDDAVAFAGAIRNLRIEYIEEPLRDSSRLAEFAKASETGAALDESLLSMEPDQFQPFSGLKAIILKPMLLGGFERAARLARKAGGCGVMPVVSSSFESGVGILSLAHFAAALISTDIPCGLDTCGRFSEDLLNHGPEIVNGRIDVGSTWQEPDVDMSILREVASG
jgi:O-succinylbenzoate synthase